MAPELGRPLLHLPLIPEDVLKKHRVNLPFDDTRFRSAARLLQALWREERGLPIGSYIGEDELAMAAALGAGPVAKLMTQRGQVGFRRRARLGADEGFAWRQVDTVRCRTIEGPAAAMMDGCRSRRQRPRLVRSAW